MLPITSHTHLMAEGVRVELTRLLHSMVFNTTPVAGYRVDLPNLVDAVGVEPTCLRRRFTVCSLTIRERILYLVP